MRAEGLQPGYRVLHSGKWHTVADVERDGHVVRVATLEGGHIAYFTGTWVSVRTKV